MHDHISRCAAAVEVLNDDLANTKEWRAMVDERVGMRLGLRVRVLGHPTPTEARLPASEAA